jgi:hypothetical protein
MDEAGWAALGRCSESDSVLDLASREGAALGNCTEFDSVLELAPREGAALGSAEELLEPSRSDSVTGAKGRSTMAEGE